MDKFQKFLIKLPKNYRKLVLLILRQIKLDYTKVPGIKRIADSDNLFIVRVGRYRIIFRIAADGEITIVKGAKRDDQTYENLK
ncbi:hypothetical protein HY604_00075 [Candidatus Peregrinibacteria bacterium]|nr:hypothetical protein [Candidatus Peregrinibacteria bacterium]